MQECEKLGETDLLPENWGWELRQGQLMPITTDKPPSRGELLNIIRCTCKKKTVPLATVAAENMDLHAARLPESAEGRAVPTLSSMQVLIQIQNKDLHT